MLYLELFSKPTLKLQPGNIETFGHKNVRGKGTEIYGWTDRITNQQLFTFTVVYLYSYLEHGWQFIQFRWFISLY